MFKIEDHDVVLAYFYQLKIIKLISDDFKYKRNMLIYCKNVCHIYVYISAMQL